MNATLLAALFTGAGTLIGVIGKIIVDVIKAKKEPDGNQVHLETRINEQKTICNQVITELSEEVNQGFSDIKDTLSDLRKSTESFQSNQMVSIRHSITEVYYRYQKEEALPSNLKQDICFLYEAYQSLGGNSYVHEIYDEMMTWKVI